MRTLITKVEPEQEGIDSTVEYGLPDNISWEVRFYCNNCGIELAEMEQVVHSCDGDEE